MPNEPIKSHPTSPDAEEWHRYLRTAKQKEPDRLEDAAKYLSTMISVSFTLFLALAGGNTTLINHPGFRSVKLAALLWLAALILAFAVLFPFPHPVASASATEIERTHRRIVRLKQLLLYTGTALFLTALIILGMVLL